MAGCLRSAELGIAAASCLFLACALLLPLSAGNSSLFPRTPIPHIRKGRPSQPCCTRTDEPGAPRHRPDVARGLSAAPGRATSQEGQSAAASHVNGRLPARCGAGWPLCPLPSLRDCVLPPGLGAAHSVCPTCRRVQSPALPAECLLKLSQFPRALHSRAVSGPTPLHGGEGQAPDEFAAELTSSTASITAGASESEGKAGEGRAGQGEGGAELDPAIVVAPQPGAESPADGMGVPEVSRGAEEATEAPQGTTPSMQSSEGLSQVGPRDAEAPAAQEGTGSGHDPAESAVPALESARVAQRNDSADSAGGQDVPEGGKGDESAEQAGDSGTGSADAAEDVPAKSTRVVPVGLEEFKRTMAQAAAATKSLEESQKPAETGSGAPREGDDGTQPNSGKSGGGVAAKVTGRRVHADGSRYNYASALHGAKVIATNPEAKRPGAVLDEDKDKYLRVPCSTKDKFLVIELSEYLTRIDAIVLSNYEYYSSSVKDFEVWGSAVYPTDQWVTLGSFTAKDVRTPQTFELPENEGQFRFLMVRVRSHHGKEFYCTLSLVRVYGMDELESLREEMMALQGGPAPVGPSSAAATPAGARIVPSDSASGLQQGQEESAGVAGLSFREQGSDDEEDELLHTPSGGRGRGTDAPEVQQGEEARSAPSEHRESAGSTVTESPPCTIGAPKCFRPTTPGALPLEGGEPGLREVSRVGLQGDADLSLDARPVVSGKESRGDATPEPERLRPSKEQPAPTGTDPEDSQDPSPSRAQNTEDSAPDPGGSVAATTVGGGIRDPPRRAEESRDVEPTEQSQNTTERLRAEVSAQQVDDDGAQGTVPTKPGQEGQKPGPAAGPEAIVGEKALNPDRSPGVPDANVGLAEGGGAGQAQREEKPSKEQAGPEGNAERPNSIPFPVLPKTGARPSADEGAALRTGMSIAPSISTGGAPESDGARQDANEAPKDLTAQPSSAGSPLATFSSGTAPPPAGGPAPSIGAFGNGLGSTAAATVSGLKAMMLRLKALEQNHSVLEQYVESVGSLYSRSLNDLDQELTALRRQVQNLTATVAGLTKRLQHSDGQCAQEKQTLKVELQEQREQHQAHLAFLSEHILSMKRVTMFSTQVCAGTTLICVLANLLTLWWRRKTFEYYP